MILESLESQQPWETRLLIGHPPILARWERSPSEIGMIWASDMLYTLTNIGDVYAYVYDTVLYMYKSKPKYMYLFVYVYLYMYVYVCMYVYV